MDTAAADEMDRVPGPVCAMPTWSPRRASVAAVAAMLTPPVTFVVEMVMPSTAVRATVAVAVADRSDTEPDALPSGAEPDCTTTLPPGNMSVVAPALMDTLPAVPEVVSRLRMTTGLVAAATSDTTLTPDARKSPPSTDSPPASMAVPPATTRTPPACTDRPPALMITPLENCDTPATSRFSTATLLLRATNMSVPSVRRTMPPLVPPVPAVREMLPATLPLDAVAVLPAVATMWPPPAAHELPAATSEMLPPVPGSVAAGTSPAMTYTCPPVPDAAEFVPPASSRLPAPAPLLALCVPPTMETAPVPATAVAAAPCITVG